MKKIKFTILTVLFATLLFSCDNELESVLISSEDADFNYKGETLQSFIVVSNTVWNATSDESWVTIDIGSGENDGEVYYDIDRNITGNSRTAHITVTGEDGANDTYSIYQTKFPMYQMWSRFDTEDNGRLYLKFEESKDMYASFYDYDTGTYTYEDVHYTYDFTETILTITSENYENYIYEYSFSSDEKKFYMTGDGTNYVYE